MEVLEDSDIVVVALPTDYYKHKLIGYKEFR